MSYVARPPAKWISMTLSWPPFFIWWRHFCREAWTISPTQNSNLFSKWPLPPLLHLSFKTSARGWYRTNDTLRWLQESIIKAKQTCESFRNWGIARGQRPIDLNRCLFSAYWRRRKCFDTQVYSTCNASKAFPKHPQHIQTVQIVQSRRSRQWTANTNI
jgi:hypothetical protein